MAINEDTVRQIIDVLKEFLPDPKVRRELAATLYFRVSANKSVEATLRKLRDVTQEDFFTVKEV